MEAILAGQVQPRDSEPALVRDMADGDEAALETLYAAYGRRLFVYAYRLTGNRAVAEEVLQDSLLAAWRGAGRYRGDGSVASWLLGIVHRQALNATRRKHLPSTSLEDAEQGSAAPGAASPDGVATVDRREALAAALADLSREQRSALELVFFQALPLAEAARVCGCPVGTIKSRLHNAKARLLQSLTKAGVRAEDVL